MTQQDRARTLLHDGTILTAKTQFANAPVEEALSLLEQAKQLATKLDDAQMIADTINAIGFAHYVAANNRRDGDPLMIRSCFQEALERRRALQDERGVSESLFHLGLISEPLGEQEAARSYYEQSLQIARRYGYQVEASNALRHLGLLEQVRGNLVQAQTYLNESLHLREQIGVNDYLPFAHHVVAEVYLAQGNIAMAFWHAQKALGFARQLDNKKALIVSLLCSGRIARRQRKMEQARNYYEQALTIAQTVDLKYAVQWSSSALQDLSTNP